MDAAFRCRPRPAVTSPIRKRCWQPRCCTLAVAVVLIESAQTRCRAANAPHLVALVRAGARFECGQLV
ncbi:hypothetical protein B5180_20350 [Streptomyces sp. BF-3]|nr:hypothetical protein B5180_20350 [Streptomyces sp. BF-3]